MDPGLDAAKRSLRTRIRRARRERGVATRAGTGRALEGADRVVDVAALEAGEALRDVVLAAAPVRRAALVAAFVSVPGEPDTGPLLAALAARDTPALLPVLREDDGLDWALDDGDRRPGARLGIPEPGGARLGEHALARADVVLVPALAVDTLGRRLGQGLGCYDRALPLAAGALVVAVLHDHEVLDAAVEPVPSGPLDSPVAAVVTPVRWRSVSGLRPAGCHVATPRRRNRVAAPSRPARPAAPPRG